MVPFIVEWIAQWNVYVPALVKVRPSLLPLPMVGVKHEPSSSVAVWPALSPLVNVMTSPTLAVIAEGLKAKFSIETLTVPAAELSAQAAAAEAAGALAGVDAAALGATEAAELPQAARARLRTAERPRTESIRRDKVRFLQISSRRVGPVVGPGACYVSAAAPVSRQYRPHVMRDDDRGHLHGIDEATMRRLLIHEARVHAMPSRELRDMGDGLLLFDPNEAEPFWNRLEALRWPTDPDAFDRRLAEAMVLFTTLSRQPHIWPSPAYDQPADLVSRLEAHGFRDMGRGCVMVLTDRERALAGAPRPYGPEVSLERLNATAGPPPEATIDAIAAILSEAFDIEDALRPGVRRETVASLGNPAFMHYVVRLGGEPAAVARRATFDGLSYLSSIGTAVWARGRGLGELATATATADAIAAGSDWIHLGVFADNAAAIRLYRRVGFELVGRPAPDLLLIG